MLKPLLARRVDQQFRRPDLAPLPRSVIEYAEGVVHGLHAALRAQVEPVYRRPEHPIDGWGLTATTSLEHGEFMGIPTAARLGQRAVYLSVNRDVIRQVITAPHPRKPLEELVVQVRNTSVPDLLRKDPSLYGALLDGVKATIEILNLNYAYDSREEPTLPDVL